MAMNKRKTTTAIVAGVTAVALLLGGTFAWTSISQQARNEAIVDINPGGRLHDDFNGKNKDVYVENFGDDITGVPIFARIRLDQYFEVGQDAGKNKTTAMEDRNVEAKIGKDINDVTTWVTYIPGADDLEDTSAVPANGNWSWNLGNETDLPIYLPTFNMNKDSLAADINGTYEGTTEGDIVNYDDYKTYTDGQAVSGTEVFDWDEDTTEETEKLNNWNNGGITTDANTPIDSADVYYKSTNDDGTALTHAAKPISTTATVMSMQAWIDAGSQPGPYWVYDTDGWAYWAQAIEPGKTTGLLLDSINMTKVPDDNYYYGINVVAQFATAGDISEFNAGEPGSDQTWTAEAEALFNYITKNESIELVGIAEDDADPGQKTILSGSSIQMDVNHYFGGEIIYPRPSNSAVTWSAADANGNAIDGVSISNGKLTVAEDVPEGTKITVTATWEGGKTGTLTTKQVIYVKLPIAYEVSYTSADGAEATTYAGKVKLDNDGYYDIDEDFVVENVVGETITVKLDAPIDFERTLNAYSSGNSGATYAQIDEDTVKISFNGNGFGRVESEPNGDYTPIRFFYVFMKDGREVVMYIKQTPNTDDTLQLYYIRDNEEPKLVDDTTVLQLGDIVYPATTNENVVKITESWFSVIEEGQSEVSYNTIKFVKQSDEGAYRYEIQLDSSYNLTETKTFTLNVCSGLHYTENGGADGVMHNTTYTLQLAK